MGRMSRVDDAQVYAAVARRLTTSGGLRLQDIVADTGVSVGSLYHRYGSREGLLARTWLDALLAFQAGFRDEISRGDDDAGERAALSTPRFCRTDRARAVVLACCRKSEFLTPDTPVALQQQIDEANEQAADTVGRFARERGHALEACRIALVAIPLGAVRLYLPDHAVPASVDRYVREAYRAVMRVDASLGE